MRIRARAFEVVSGAFLSLLPGARSQTETTSKVNKPAATASNRPAVPGHRTWSDYAGAADGAQYSALAQINRSNANQLQIAWNYSTGDGTKYLYNPTVVHRTMYVLAQNDSVVALDAATG